MPAWNSLGRRRSGSYTPYRNLGHWQVLTRDPDLWPGLLDGFCVLCDYG